MPLPNLVETLQLGQLLMVETQNEILIGHLKLIDGTGQIIELENVRDFNTNYVYTSAQILHRPEIKSIRVIENDTNEETSESTTNNNTSIISTSSPPSSSSLHPDHVEHQHKENSNILQSHPRNEMNACDLNLSNRELIQIQDQLANTTYIFQTDQLYHKALADIRTQSVIGLVLDPMDYGRHNKTSLLTIATDRAVYIFDIMFLGKIFREFKEILESKRPRKAIHYSHRIVDNLKRRQNVELGGIFDTFVAHCLIAGTKTPLSLVEAVEVYFNISDLYFFESQAPKNPVDTYNRPVPKDHLQLLAKKAIFQYKLHEHLLHEQMLSQFYRQCQTFASTFSTNDDSVEVVMQMKPNSRQGFEQIKPEGGWNRLLEKNFSEKLSLKK